MSVKLQDRLARLEERFAPKRWDHFIFIAAQHHADETLIGVSCGSDKTARLKGEAVADLIKRAARKSQMQYPVLIALYE